MHIHRMSPRTYYGIIRDTIRLCLCQSFSKRVVAYPIGTYVLLSNGDQGEVSDINPDVPLRPIVKIIKHATDGNYETVNLCESLSTTIEKVIYQIE